jgi:hypothetical protein
VCRNKQSQIRIHDKKLEEQRWGGRCERGQAGLTLIAHHYSSFTNKCSACQHHPEWKKKSMKKLKTLRKHNHGRQKSRKNSAGVEGSSLVCEQGALADTSSSPADPSSAARRCSLTSDLPPNDRVGNLQGLADGRGCRARVPLESPPPRRPSETLAAADRESLLLPRIANRRRRRRLGMLRGNGIWVGMYRGLGVTVYGWEDGAG